MQNKFVCIHAHFYQPPRENPYLEEIEDEDSAYPYPNWNERITRECYLPNAFSRILDRDGYIKKFVNNYSRISFNFGPTLLSWIKEKKPLLYQAILEANRISIKNYGFPSAMAQIYHHIIMPLAEREDKLTEVIWAVEFYKHHFKCLPQGMWLPECAVDLETLDILAEKKINFVILAPHQAKRVRNPGEEKWQEVKETLDIKIPYLCNLPSGRKINIFFYNGIISNEVAFGGLLNNGENFARRLLGEFSPDTRKELVHIATDGETYGHHHRFGEMALSFCLDYLKNQGVSLTIYPKYLKENPPQYEVQIVENTSWSCAHGVERWRSNCGCKIGGGDQTWRHYLRQAMDYLRGQLWNIYFREAAALIKDPVDARNDYIKIICDNSYKAYQDFLKRHKKRDLSSQEEVKVFKLLKLQEYSLLMYTSCGWFFDDITGLEAQQVIKYAQKAMEMAKDITGVDLEDKYLEIIKQAKSRCRRFRSIKNFYLQHIKKSKVSPFDLMANYSVLSLFKNFSIEEKFFSCSIKRSSYNSYTNGKMKFIALTMKVYFYSTTEVEDFFSFAFLLDEDNIFAVVDYLDEERFADYRSYLQDIFLKSDIVGLVSFLKENFPQKFFSLSQLLKTTQKSIYHYLFMKRFLKINDKIFEIYDENCKFIEIIFGAKLLQFIHLLPLLDFVFTQRIKKILSSDEVEIKKIKRELISVKKYGIRIDKKTVEDILIGKLNKLIEEKELKTWDDEFLIKIETLIKIARLFSLNLDLWWAQNLYFLKVKELASKNLPDKIKNIKEVGKLLKVKIL